MDHSHSTTTSHKKGKHLTYAERVLIQIRLKDNYSIRAIAREIGCSPSTVSNEIARGSVFLYNGHVTRYKASAGQKAYENNRKHSCRHYDFLSKSAFLEYVMKHFTEDGWSLDACAFLMVNLPENRLSAPKHFTAMLILASLASETITFLKSLSVSPRNIDYGSTRKSWAAALRNVPERSNPVRNSGTGNVTSYWAPRPGMTRSCSLLLNAKAVSS